MCQALQIRCNNPQCQQPFTATRRYTEDGQTLFYACDTCIYLLNGPRELDFMCRDCGHGFMDCTCYDNKEFMYGGPIVICTECLKQTVWLDSRGGTGFAGGRIYLDTFSCGHNIMDESDDMLAAI